MKTHDLLQLLENCNAIDNEFQTLKLDAAVLSPFATEFRYPIDASEELIIERHIVLDAIARAEKILFFVEKKLSSLNVNR